MIFNNVRIIGKIDIYDKKKELLVERKKHIKEIYDGYVFQLYAQYYCMTEMGYNVSKLQIRSCDDNKIYKINCFIGSTLCCFDK